MAGIKAANRISNLALAQKLPGVLGKQLSQMLGKTTYQDFGLNESYPGTPKLPTVEYEPTETTVSSLSNGIQVVSKYTADPICNVGLWVNAGSRYCSPDTSGTGHFLESLSVEGTRAIGPQRWAENMSRTGTSVSVQAFRDAMVYQGEGFAANVPFMFESIAEMIWNPRLEDWRLDRIHKEYLWRRGDVMKDSDHEIPELMHQAAYQGNTVGLPLFCDHNTVKNMSREVIEEFISIFYEPKRITVVGTGLKHDELEKLAQNTFGDLQANPQFQSLNFEDASYTGGQMKMKYDFEADEPATHVALLFETENWHSPDLMALCVLNMMMGGGASFSAGGPGKGMYTRLYRDVLGNHHWIQHVSCSHSIFNDTGLFCLYGFAPPDHAGDLTGVMLREALDMVARPPATQELDRAKTALASNICFEAENRHVVFEDLARQIQVYGDFKTPEMWREKIMAVTKDDVTRVAKNLFSSKPTLLALGPDVTRVPTYDEIETFVKSQITA